MTATGGTPPTSRAIAVPGDPASAPPAPVIVLIEDEMPVRRFMRAALENAGYRLFEASTAEDGLAEVAARQPALIIVDLGLPDFDGFEVIRRLREWPAVPIIVLSARGQERDKVGALDAGADDYMSKPVGVGELLARIRVALRHWAKTRGPNDTTITIGDLTVDLVRHSAFVAGHEVHLTAIESKLLKTFARSPGKVLTQSHLVKEVWGSSGAQRTGALRVHILQLRRKLEADPVRPRYLLTEPGVGYRLAGE
jgi:two-component system, OmpR family, KDP operon response regulator KdpE